jgi:hypothetical protein
MQARLLVASLILGVSLGALWEVEGATDATLEERTSGWDVADAVVRKIRRSGIFQSDQNFVRRVGYVETSFGEDDKTYRPEYYGGIWQVDESYFNATKSVNSTVLDAVKTQWDIDWNLTTWQDLLKPLYSGLGFRLYMEYLSEKQGKQIPGTVELQGTFWVQNYRPNGTAQEYKDAVKRLESDGGNECEPLFDVALILDGSGSIEDNDFEIAKVFISDLVKSFNMEEGATRLSFILFGENAYKIFDFNHNMTTEQIHNTILNVIHPKEYTNTPAGLLMAVDFYKAILPRSGVPQVVITFTDGQHNRGDLPAAVKAVKEANLTSFAIGITAGSTYSELLEIALLDPAGVFMVQDFDALAEFIYNLNSVTCEIPSEPDFGASTSGSLRQGERRYFAFRENDPDHFGLEFNIAADEVKGWYSFTDATPNSAVNDGEIMKGNNVIPFEGEGPISVYVTIEGASSSDDKKTNFTVVAEKMQDPPTTTTTEEPTTTTTQEPTTTTEEPTTEDNAAFQTTVGFVTLIVMSTISVFVAV